MRFQYAMWKLFVATAAVALLFAVVRPPTQVVPAVATFVAAGGLAGLILLGNQANIGTIWRSTSWTLFGAFIGSLLSPSPFFHPPHEPLFFGAVSGWALSVALGIRRRRKKVLGAGRE